MTPGDKGNFGFPLNSIMPEHSDLLDGGLEVQKVKFEELSQWAISNPLWSGG